MCRNQAACVRLEPNVRQVLFFTERGAGLDRHLEWLHLISWLPTCWTAPNLYILDLRAKFKVCDLNALPENGNTMVRMQNGAVLVVAD